MRLLAFVLVALFGLSMSTGCDNFISKNTDSVYMDYDHQRLGYRFFSPDKKHFLSYDLEEISGLTYYQAGRVAAIEDENGFLYIINVTTGKVERKIAFSDPEDFEGVEIIDNQVYVIASNGDLYTFELASSNDIRAKKIETPLTRKNDVEGLAYYHGKLWMALKGDEDIDSNDAKGKAVYAYDLDKKSLISRQWLSISLDDLSDFVKNRKYFNRVHDFDPSGIAIHPMTNDIYLLSADGYLAILTPDHALKELIKLNPITYNQAEGICFSPDGTCYISSEGAGGKGKLMQINYLKQTGAYE